MQEQYPSSTSFHNYINDSKSRWLYNTRQSWYRLCQETVHNSINLDDIALLKAWNLKLINDNSCISSKSMLFSYFGQTTFLRLVDLVTHAPWALLGFFLLHTILSFFPNTGFKFPYSLFEFEGLFDHNSLYINSSLSWTSPNNGSCNCSSMLGLFDINSSTFGFFDYV